MQNKMSSTTETAPQRYLGIVFKRAPSSPDFGRAGRVVLPGQHAEQEAWAAVFAALRAGGPLFIGGEVAPADAENRAEQDAENRS